MDKDLLHPAELPSTSTLVLYKKVLEYERAQTILGINTSPELDRLRSGVEESLRLIRTELTSRSQRAQVYGWGE